METSPVLPSPDLARWAPLAREEAATPLQLAVPLEVLLAEGVALAAFVQERLAPSVRPDGSTRPGLVSANRRHAPLLFGDETVHDLLSLVATTRDAQTRYALVVRPGGRAALRERADFVLSELEGALDFLLDDGVDEPFDAQLAQLHDQRRRSDSDASLAGALHAYATLAREPELAQALTELDSFDASLVDEAGRLADALLPAPHPPGYVEPEAQALLATRNQLAHLLQRQLRLIRAAARYVYRHDPAIARQATSTYERRRRAAARRRALALAPESPPEVA